MPWWSDSVSSLLHLQTYPTLHLINGFLTLKNCPLLQFLPSVWCSILEIVKIKKCCVTFIFRFWNNWNTCLLTCMLLWKLTKLSNIHYKTFCKTIYSLPLPMGGYPIGMLYFISKSRESNFVQYSTFLETKLNDLVSS